MTNLSQQKMTEISQRENKPRLSCIHPVSLNFSSRRFIVSLVGTFLPGKNISGWFRSEIHLYYLDTLLHAISFPLDTLLHGISFPLDTLLHGISFPLDTLLHGISFPLDTLLHGISFRLSHWSWEIELSTSNYYLPGKQKLGLIWYEMTSIIKWIHLF